MSERQEIYATATAPIGEVVNFTLEAWERNAILRMRQAARTGQMIIIDPDARCWYVVGKFECNKEQRSELPFKI